MLYHASGVEVEFPEIRKSKYTKDFSWGFYCTNDYEQAKRWARRNKENPTINYYSFNYDIVEGPMADDAVWNFVNDFLDGDITRAAFWELAKFKHPTHQISFHTLKALNCLTFERSEVINE